MLQIFLVSAISKVAENSIFQALTLILESFFKKASVVTTPVAQNDMIFFIRRFWLKQIPLIYRSFLSALLIKTKITKPLELLFWRKTRMRQKRIVWLIVVHCLERWLP